ncbi:hypothetical protein GQ42DRAFT_168952 [Ramicandelaber brevisporus]|nr:hypothetical protein GQ42DRAFT_168952 [Ramicandelaber brevisporus]
MKTPPICRPHSGTTRSWLPPAIVRIRIDSVSTASKYGRRSLAALYVMRSFMSGNASSTSASSLAMTSGRWNSKSNVHVSVFDEVSTPAKHAIVISLTVSEWVSTSPVSGSTAFIIICNKSDGAFSPLSISRTRSLILSEAKSTRALKLTSDLTPNTSRAMFHDHRGSMN